MGGCFEFPYEDLVKVPERGVPWESLEFIDNLILGYYFKSLAILLFDRAGYEVYPFGWESLLPTLKRRLYAGSQDEVERKIRTAPDLVLRDPEDGSCSLVEVKYRTGGSDEFPKGESVTSIHIKEVSEYKQFWPESIILLFTSAKNYIYAQKVNQLGNWSDKGYIPLEYEFDYAEEVFPLLRKLDEQFRRVVARKVAIMHSLRKEGRI
jgi:hypothetical protein